MATKKPAASNEAAAPRKAKNNESLRDTVEAVAIAFIMAFVFKTFEAELYVIPTGSMAPTLYGRHKEVECDGCRYAYAVGASQELDQNSGIVQARLLTSTCPNCRYSNDVIDAPVFNGDRILVNKQNRSYDRFDVVVFKNPEESHVNYIKRCVGLPGEIIRIHQGDIFAARGESEPFEIQRKADLRIQRDIQIPVYDDRFPPAPLLEAGAEERWIPAERSEAANAGTPWAPVQNGWTADREQRTYRFESSADSALQWLRYRHLIPSSANWKEVLNTERLTARIMPSLIADFCGFNSYDTAPQTNGGDDGELYWVGDLTLNATITVEDTGPDPLLRLQLVEGPRTYSCDIHVDTGLAEIRMADRQLNRDEVDGSVLVSAETPVIGPGEYAVTFANVDERLCLWIDDDLIPLGTAVEFSRSLEPIDASDDDLAPAGIAARNLTARVADLVIERDIYYRNDTVPFSPADIRTPAMGQSPRSLTETPVYDQTVLEATLRSPAAYADLYRQLTERQLRGNEEFFTYRLADDEYLMCGDNSPASQDSRLFLFYSRPYRGIRSNRFAVREQDLIGEAMFIFWPHGIPFLNDGKGFTVLNHREFRNNQVVRGTYPAWRFPFYPNFSRMKRIR